MSNCLVDVSVEVPPETVTGEWDRILGEFQSMAKLPGFRPGKAPRAVVERRYRKDIHDETTRVLISKGIQSAIKDNDLAVLEVAKVDDIEIAEDKRLTFSTSIIVSPDFDLPEYKGIGVQVPPREITDDEVGEAIERLRAQHADYREIPERGARIEDYAVLDYQATVDGQPLAERAPEAAKFFGQNEDFWLRLVDDAFLPGFTGELLGMRPGETREFDIGIAGDFPREDLRGLTLHYTVTLKSLREQILPEPDDELAGRIVEGKSLDEVRELIRQDMAHQKERRVDEFIRRAVMDDLLKRVEFDLPEKYLREETRRILEDMVEENRRRGVPEAELANHKDELVQGAGRQARNSLKSRFLLIRIARAEGIEATDRDVATRISRMAHQSRMAPDQVRKEIEKRGAMDSVREDILTAKALDFVVSNANVTENPDLFRNQESRDE